MKKLSIIVILLAISVSVTIWQINLISQSKAEPIKFEEKIFEIADGMGQSTIRMLPEEALGFEVDENENVSLIFVKKTGGAEILGEAKVKKIKKNDGRGVGYVTVETEKDIILDIIAAKSHGHIELARIR